MGARPAECAGGAAGHAGRWCATRRRPADVVFPAVASEIAGQATHGTAAEPYMRFAAALGAGAIPDLLKAGARAAGLLPGMNRAPPIADVRPAAEQAQVSAAKQTIAANAVPAWPTTERVVKVKVGPVDDLWQREPDHHIPPTPQSGQSIKKLDQAKRFILGLPDAPQPFKTPSIVIEPGRRAPVQFRDGRHRFAAMREFGFDEAPVSMDAASIAEARKLGLLAWEPVRDLAQRLLLASPTVIPTLLQPDPEIR